MIKEVLRELNKSDLLNQTGRILAEQPELFQETFYEMRRHFEGMSAEMVSEKLATSSLVGADDEKAIHEWVAEEEQGVIRRIAAEED